MLPSCRAADRLLRPSQPAPCACKAQWARLIASTDVLPGYREVLKQTCWDEDFGADAASECPGRDPPCGQAFYDGNVVVRPLPAGADRPEGANGVWAMDHTPPGACPGCSANGWCSRGAQGTVQNARAEGPKCWCDGFFHGENCTVVTSSPAHAPWFGEYALDGNGYCLNSCSGKGRCEHGTCVCDAGRWGMDCSLHEGWAPHGHRPLVYVFDLPPESATWHLWYYPEGPSQDEFQRRDGVHWIEYFLQTKHRTMDPTEADFFFVPFAGSPVMDRRVAFRAIDKHWPGLLGTRPAILAPMMADVGPQRYHGVPEVRERLGDKLVLLSAHGLHEGSSWLQVKGWFRPGVDVVVPSAEWEFDRDPSRKCVFDDRGGRPTLLFFRGHVLDDVPGHDVRKELRSALEAQNATAAFGWTFARGREQHGAQFCAAMHGAFGGWAQREFMAVMDGCIPVWPLDNATALLEEALPRDAYMVTVAEAELRGLPAALRALPEPARARLRTNGACACRYMLEAGRDALDEAPSSWTALLAVLAARVGADPPPSAPSRTCLQA